jgi:hypothetical protein
MATTPANLIPGETDGRSPVVVMFQDRGSAAAAYKWLLGYGYDPADLAFLVPEEVPDRPALGSTNYWWAHIAAGAALGGGVGGLIVGLLGAFLGDGTLMWFPNLGRWFPGQLFFGMTGAVTGAIAGSVLGAGIGWFIPAPKPTAAEAGATAVAVLSVEPRPGDEVAIKTQLRQFGGQILYKGA